MNIGANVVLLKPQNFATRQRGFFLSFQHSYAQLYRKDRKKPLATRKGLRKICTAFHLKPTIRNKTTMIGYSASLVCGMIISSSVMANVVRVADDLEIHYQKSGHGAISVLLVPGWTMSSEVYEKQLQYFSDSNDFTLYAIDPRSQGKSSKTSDGNYYEQHGRDVNSFLKAMGLRKVVLGGWSNGGFDILSYVDQFGSEAVAGLIMIDAAPTGTGLDNTKEWVWYNKNDSDGYRQSITQKSLMHRDELNDEFAKWMVASPTPEYMKWVKGIANQTSNQVAAILNESSAYQDYSSTLKGLEGKVKLLYFANSEKIDAARVWSAANTPSAQVVPIQKHLSFWEDPQIVNQVLAAYLKEVKYSLKQKP